MQRKWRRRNYFIKKDMQGRYMFLFFLFVLLGSIIFTAIFSLLAYNTLTIVYDDYTLRIDNTPMALIKEILKAHWLFILTGGVVVVVISMFLTHRVAGPMYRFEKTIDDLCRGNLNFSVRLRKHDEGKELAEKLNALLEIYSSRLKEIKALSDNIYQRLRKAAEEEDDSKRKALIEEAVRLHEELKERLSFFRTEDQ